MGAYIETVEIQKPAGEIDQVRTGCTALYGGAGSTVYQQSRGARSTHDQGAAEDLRLLPFRAGSTYVCPYS